MKATSQHDYRPKRRGATLDLGELVDEMRLELRCLLGPQIELEISLLPGDNDSPVRAAHDHLVDLLRHLALDARHAMHDGGRVCFRSGALAEAPGSSVLVVHEIPHPLGRVMRGEAPGKARSLSLTAAYRSIERAGGHFHAFCRGRETMLTLCLPRA